MAGLTSGEIRELEVLLARLGFDPGPIDGQADDRTAAAVRGYQIFAALPADGEASEELLAELRGVVATLTALKDEPTGEAEPEPESVVAHLEPVSAMAQPEPEPVVAQLASSRNATPDLAPAPAEPAAEDAGQAELAEAETDKGIGATERDFAVQLATMSSAEGAWREWARLKETMPELLADMPPKVTSLDRDDGGALYRVLTGPLPDRAAAADFCTKIQASGQDCIPVPGHLIETGLVEPPDPLPPATAAQVEAQTEPAAPAPAVQTAALPGAGRASFVRAGETFMNGDCQGAVRLYTGALELGGLTPEDSATAYNNRGRCYFTQARYDEALADHGAAIELQPEFAAAYFNRGRAYQAKGERSLAEADLSRAYDLGFRRLGSLSAAGE